MNDNDTNEEKKLEFLDQDVQSIYDLLTDMREAYIKGEIDGLMGFVVFKNDPAGGRFFGHHPSMFQNPFNVVGFVDTMLGQFKTELLFSPNMFLGSNAEWEEFNGEQQSDSEDSEEGGDEEKE